MRSPSPNGTRRSRAGAPPGAGTVDTHGPSTSLNQISIDHLDLAQWQAFNHAVTLLGAAMDRLPEINVNRNHGQGLVEYGLIIALVAVIAIAGLILLGPAVSSLLSNLAGSV